MFDEQIPLRTKECEWVSHINDVSVYLQWRFPEWNIDNDTYCTLTMCCCPERSALSKTFAFRNIQNHLYLWGKIRSDGKIYYWMDELHFIMKPTYHTINFAIHLCNMGRALETKMCLWQNPHMHYYKTATFINRFAVWFSSKCRFSTMPSFLGFKQIFHFNLSACNRWGCVWTLFFTHMVLCRA